MLRAIRNGFRSLFRRGTLDREMQTEMETHLDLASERLIARGMSADEARLAARREFGNLTWLREEGRRAHGGEWLQVIAGDARYAVRQFARAPLSTATMILVLALGIGANTALFAILHAVTMRPAPGIPRDDAVIRIRGWERGMQGGTRMDRYFSLGELQDHVDQRQLFSDVAAWSSSEVVLGLQPGTTVPVDGAAHYVTSNYFDVLGVRLALGTGLPRAPSSGLSTDLVAVIGYATWEREFSRSTEVLGSTITVNDVPVTIVGVAAPRFAGVLRTSRPRALWLPLGTRAIIEKEGPLPAMSADSARLLAVGRLHPRVTGSQAQAVVQAIARRHAPASATRRGRAEWSTDIQRLRSGYGRLDVDSEDVIASAVFGAITLLILGITCATVSTLLVGNAVARQREIAVRFALGASRGRVLRQLLTESILLALGAGLLGLAVLWASARVIQPSAPDFDFVVGWETGVFTIAFAAATAILFGLAPALHATRLSISEALKNSASAIASVRSRLQRSLVVVQIALSQPMLLGLAALGAMFIQGVGGDSRTNVRERILSVAFNSSAGAGSAEQSAQALAALRERVARVPGVEATVPYHPSGYTIADYVLHPADRTPDGSIEGFFAEGHSVSPGHFALLDIPVVRGREFGPEDPGASPMPVIIGADLARMLWGSADPIGRRFTRLFRGKDTGSESVVIGVIDATAGGTSDESSKNRIYVPDGVRPDRRIDALYVRTRGPAEPLIPTIRALASVEAPGIPIMSIETLASIDTRARAERLYLASGAAGGGLLALLLSSIGLYAVIAFAVAQRTREIGIRIALGGNRRQVVGVFLRTGLRLTTIGLAIGLPIGLLVVRMLSDMIRMPVWYLPMLMVGIAIVVMVIALIATWLPARRATMVDPLIALRAE